MKILEYIERLRRGLRPTPEEAQAAGDLKWWTQVSAREALDLMYQWDDVPLLIGFGDLQRMLGEFVPGGVFTYELGDAALIRKMLETGKRDTDPVTPLIERIGPDRVVVVEVPDS